MKPQAFQHPEIRDENDNIIQPGAFGKNTPFCTKGNDGILDYVANDLEYLYKQGAADNKDFKAKSLAVTGTSDLNLVNADTVKAKSLAITGTSEAPTAPTGDNSKTIANTEFVQNAVSGLVGAAPETLDTLNELATALGNDPNFATTVSNQIGKKANQSDLETVASFVNRLQRKKAYKVGDIVYSSKLPSWAYLECTQAGTTGNTEPNLSTISGGVEVNDGSVKWTVKTVTAKEYVDEKLNNYGKMETINATIDSQYIENLSCVKIKNIVHLFVRMKSAKEGLIEIASGLPKSFINLEFYALINNSNGKAVRLTINTDGKLYLSYTDEYTTSPGHESVACLVYLTND